MTAVEVDALRRRFGPTRALDGLSFRLGRGVLFGLVGPDGGGKTTTLRVLTGLLRPDGGSVAVLGVDPTRAPAAWRERIGLMPQEHSLYADLSIAENLRFFGRLFCLPRSEFHARTDRLLHITRLSPFVDRRAGALSGGMYKKLALACALLHRPEVLFLDEPTNGVDPVSRRELWELVHELVAEGMTVVVSTPYMDEAERCHAVGLLHRGRLVAEGDPRSLVATLDHETYEVVGGDRAAAVARVEALPAVVAASPAGARLRIVVEPGAGGRVARALDDLGAVLRATAPTFEDVFLVRTREAQEEA